MPVEHLAGERALELGGAGHLAGEVALELLVVAGDDLLDDLVVEPVLLVGDVGGDRLVVVGAVGLVLEAFVGEHVGDAVQLLLLAEGQLERDEPAAERRPQLVERAVEVGARLVLLVDEHEARDAEGGATAPRRLRAHLDAVDGADHEHGEVGDRQRRVHLAGEVGVARRVEEVDLVRRRLAGGRVGGLHSNGATASESDILRLISSGSVSQTVLPSSVLPARWSTPAR